MRALRTSNALVILVALAAVAGSIEPLAAQTLGVYRELWTGLTAGGLAGLTNSLYNPRWPDNPEPGYTRLYPGFETEANTGLNNYGQRLRAYLVPTATGKHTFWIASDDNSALFLSTDDSPAHVQLVASVITWTGSREWTKETNQQSAPISLVSGKRYYIEAIMQQGGGGDNLAVGWQTPGSTQTNVIGGANLQVDSAPSIRAQPAGLTVPEVTTASFTVGVSNFYPPRFQWWQGATRLFGATNATLTLSNVPLTYNGVTFVCVLTNFYGGATSAPALLTVIRDTNAPALVSAVNLTLTNILVTYSEPVAASTATNLGNYAVNPGISLLGAVMSTPVSVELLVSPLTLGSNYTLTVNRVRDLAATPNVIASNSQVTFGARDFVPADIGSPFPAGASVVVTNGLDVSGGGVDIGGASDQFQFDYQKRNGDFDVQVRIAGLTQSDPWAKAGLMARETLDPGSRFAAALATPTLAGCLFESRVDPGAVATTAGALPVNYPLTWLRLRRVGNLFTGYASLDGSTWVQLGSATLSVAGVYLGFAVTSHQPGTPTLAQFRDFAPVTGGTIGTVALPNEPLGPCSRRTGLVISEIMYKPAPRLDGQNLEFIELYNSNPWAEDISGHRLTGDVNFVFPTNTALAGGAFLVIAAAPPSLQLVYGIANVTGPYTGSLKKSGLIQLTDKYGVILLEVPYSDLPPWPVAAGGTGHSLVLARPTFGEGDGRAWAISDVVGGSPGRPEAFRPSPLRSVLLNEILPHSESSTVPGYIELYNHSNLTNDLSGCILTDDPAANKFIIPPGTRLRPRSFLSFDQTQLGFALNGAGGTVFFWNPDRSRVLDAVQYEAQADGVPYGRYPDGAADFHALAARTPGARNTNILIRDIVINELMYKPISGNNDDQYVELYNKGSNAVDLGGWTFTAGLNFTFPSNTVLLPDGYLVVARNMTNLFARYPNLSVANTVGDFTGALSHQGERVALAMPQSLTSTNGLGAPITNIVFVVQDEVTYGAGGRWGQWAGGGGSSLELIDPNTNHRLAYNWADSDETSKSVWTNLESTGVLDLGGNYTNGPIDLVQLGLLDVGECLVDNVEVRPGSAGANYIANSSFENGLTNWTPQGDHIRSSLETNGGYASAQCLHLRSSDSVYTLFNSVQGALTNYSLVAGQTATLRLKARWLRGWPEILMRLRGNWLELSGALPVPSNLGTPGQRNSHAVTNAPPAIYEVTHAPPLPAANQAFVVSARVHSMKPFAAILLYRIDTGVNPKPAYTSVTMADAGTAGDAIASDGIYSATIPAQPAGTVVAFLVQARGIGATTNVFPADLKDHSGLPRECVVVFGDPNPGGTFSHHHVWLTQNWIDRWNSLGGLSNETQDGTFVDGGGRIIYDWVGRFAGSPAHQYLGSPVTTLGGQHWTMPEDDQFLGTTSFNKQHVPGNGPLDDTTLQREQTSYWMARQIGLPWNYRRYYVLYVNGNRHGPLMEDGQVPGADFLKQRWPNDHNGFLYKNNIWFEGDTTLQPGGYLNISGLAGCTLGEFTSTVSGVPNQHKLARYRWIYWIRQFPDSANNYTNVYALVDAANTSVSSPAYYSSMEAEVDTEEWMRMSAIEHATGDWDSFTRGGSWNMYCYKPLAGKWTLLKWDWNISLGVGGYSWGPDGSNLFTDGDPVLAAFQNYPPYLRAYLRAFKDLAAVAMNNACVDPVLDGKYAAFAANGLTTAYGVTVAEPGAAGLKSWIGTMRTSLLAALTNQGVANVSFAVSGPLSRATGNNVVILTGVAPLEVKSVTVNGTLHAVTWSSVTNWQLSLVLSAATNPIVVQGLDLAGNPLGNLAAAVSVIYTNPLPPLAGGIVINEIMYHPLVTNAQYLELYNTSSAFTFDLSNWRLQGVDYTFAPGSLLAPGKFLVLAKDRAAFASAYGTNIPVFDVFGGALPFDGTTLTLLAPGAGSAPDQVVDQVTYSSAAPWPAAANGGGFSLQLIDPAQDRQRVANWFGGIADTGGWSYASASGLVTGSNLLIYPDTACDVYLDDIALVPAAGPLAGVNVVQNGDFESALSGPWIVPTNLNGTAITADLKHAGAGSLHLVTASGGGSLAKILQQPLPAGATNVMADLSFWYHPGKNGTNLTVRVYPGSGLASRVSIQSANSQTAWFTPGRTNSLRVPLSPFPALWLNEIQPANLAGPTDRFGNHSPWVELYNGGANAIDLTGFSLADNYTNLNQWPFPSNTLIDAGRFLLVWLDGNLAASTNTELHAGFTVAPTTGSVALAKAPAGSKPILIDYLNYSVPRAGYSYGDYPDGNVAGRRVFAVITPGATNNPAPPPLAVFINEWMAGNTHTRLNPADGNYDDWFELYNADTYSADLSGCFLSHSAGNNSEFRIPNGYAIPPLGYLLVWADKLPAANTNASGDLHANFHLPATGGVLGLFAPDLKQVDYISYGAQSVDVSQGRCPDGGPAFLSLPTATPRARNACSANTPPVLASISDQTLYLGQTLSFTATATDAESPPETLSFSLAADAPSGATIGAASGQFAWTPLPAQAPSTNALTVLVMDNGSPPLSASQTFTVTVLAPLQIGSLARNGNQVTLGWSSAPGKTYRLQYRDDLASGAWLPLGNDIPATGTTATASITLTGSGQRFFRILVLQ